MWGKYRNPRFEKWISGFPKRVRMFKYLSYTLKKNSILFLVFDDDDDDDDVYVNNFDSKLWKLTNIGVLNENSQ